jgi:hypothetical protein
LIALLFFPIVVVRGISKLFFFATLTNANITMQQEE